MPKNTRLIFYKENLLSVMLFLLLLLFLISQHMFQIHHHAFMPTTKKNYSLVTHYGLVNSQTVQKYFKVLLGHSQILNIVLHFIVVT